MRSSPLHKKANTEYFARIPEAVEDIDIGGVTLLRAAAKNFSRGKFGVSFACSRYSLSGALKKLQNFGYC